MRRFDLEHTFRLFKQVLGWTAPKIRDPAAADRWTWLIIACYAQLRLARPLAADLRLPWQRPCPPGRLTSARVRRDFRNIRVDRPVGHATGTSYAVVHGGWNLGALVLGTARRPTHYERVSCVGRGLNSAFALGSQGC